MTRDRSIVPSSPDTVISIIGPGMTVTGDCETDGTLRIEGRVDGNVHAGKAVVIGRDGVVEGTIATRDAVVSGRVIGILTAESRLELQATSYVEGEIRVRRMQLAEGAVLNGTVQVGDQGSLSRGEPEEERSPFRRAAALNS